MPRTPDSGRLDLAEVFYSVQEERLAQLAVGGFFERAAPAFVIDSYGRRSRQIDIAIFDNLYSPLLFPHKYGRHLDSFKL